MNGATNGYHHSYEAEPEEDDYIPSDKEIREAQSLKTDAANAAAVADDYPENFRYVAEWDAWICWDSRRWYLSSGKGSARDVVYGNILRTLQLRYMLTEERLEVAEEELRVCMLTHTKDDPVTLKMVAKCKSLANLSKWYESSQNASRIASCETLLRGRFAVAMKDIDRQPWLFNVANGTIDLRTGELRDHRRADYITQFANIEYDDYAKCPNWEAFISTAMGGDLIMRLYVQRLVGYTLTGTTQEHVLIFHYGHTGSNGKSTFMTALRNLMGEYGCSAPRTLLFESKSGDPHPTELARLYGKRLATCSEVPQDMEIAEAKVKDLTGGDHLAVRRMNENFWDLTPTHTLHLAGNHKPIIRGTDGGIWRRIKLVPWEVEITSDKQDKDLGAKLAKEMPGILRWAVHGCLEWQNTGMAEPPSVALAVASYRKESDALGEFFEFACVFSPESTISKDELRSAYETWCEECGNTPHGAKYVARRLDEKKVLTTTVRRSAKVKTGWRGVRLKTEMEMISTAEIDSNSRYS